MESVTRRPAALFCLSFVGIGFVGIHLPPAIRWSFAAVCAVLFCVSLFGRFPSVSAAVRRTLRIVLCALLLGNIYFSVCTDLCIRTDIRRFDGRTAEITAVVEECTYSSSYMAEYRIRLRSADGKAARFRVLLETPYVSLHEGDVIRCSAQFTPFEKLDAGFAEERYYFSEGIRMRAEAEEIRVTETVSAGFSARIREMRLALRARLRVSLGREASALPAALFLGDRSLLSEAFTRDFRRLGVSHLLAISGLHFTLILRSAERFLASFLPARKMRLPVLVGLTVVYILLSGSSGSVLRAGLMMLIAFGAVPFSRSEDMPTALGVSAFLICTLNPAAYYSVGLQLSVAAIGALLCCSHFLKQFSKEKSDSRIRRFLGKIGKEIFLAAAVQLIILPLLCLYFGEISLLTPLAVLLFAPLIRLILHMTPLLLLFPHLVPLSRAVQFLTELTETLASAAAYPRGITVPLTFPLCILFAVLLTASCILLTFVRGRRAITIVFSSFCLIAAGFGAYLSLSLAQNAAETAVISSVYKKNDAFAVVSEGKYLLCDFSDGSYSAMNAPYESLRLHHATELEGLLLTHLHTRHIRTFERISDKTYVRALILPLAENEKESDIADSLIACAAEKGIPVYTYNSAAHSTVHFGDVQLQPQRTYISRSTHPIITLSAAADGKTVQYLGTSFSEKVTPAGVPDVLIFGVHGPIYKKTFTLPSLSDETEILFRGSSADYCRSPLPGDVPRQTEDTVRIRFCP